MPHNLGSLVLAAKGPSAADEQQQQRMHVIDGGQRVLTLCLLLAAARSCLLDSGSVAGCEAAKKIRHMLVQVRVGRAGTRMQGHICLEGGSTRTA